MRAFYCDHFVLPLPEGHRFPMEKYALLRQRVSARPDIELVVPEAATSEQLERVHSQNYVARVLSGALDRDEIRRIGFPWSPELAERSRRSVGGTIEAGRVALADGIAVNLAGGTHHAFPDHGEGFCVFNDVAVAVRDLEATRGVSRIAVIDLDVHQGNGTASIFEDDDSVFTVSVHGANNYPFRKQQSDLDVELADGTGDAPFLEAVSLAVDTALASRPEVVFFIAGADPFEHDRLGRLGVTAEGLLARDERVFDACSLAGVPVAVVMSGGYAQDVADTVGIHEATVLAAADRVATERVG